MKAFINNPIFRWIAVLPGSVLAVFLATFPVLWIANISYLTGWPWPSLVQTLGHDNLQRLGTAFSTPLVWIMVTAMIAPRHKVAIGRVAALLMWPILIFGLIDMLTSTSLTGGGVYLYIPDSGLGNLYPVIMVALWVTSTYVALRFNTRYSTD